MKIKKKAGRRASERPANTKRCRVTCGGGYRIIRKRLAD